MIPSILELLRTGQTSFSRTDLEYKFRLTLTDIINHLPHGEHIRAHIPAIPLCLIYILRHDNEDMGALACKTLVDYMRLYRFMPEDVQRELASIFMELQRNVCILVDQTLSEDSAVLDPTIALPSIRSFKVATELGLYITFILNNYARAQAPEQLQLLVEPAFELLQAEAPAQKAAREDCEAMGDTWYGMAPTIKNAQAYSDFMLAQIKMLSFVIFVERTSPEMARGDQLMLSAFRIMQDLPSTSFALRRDIMVPFRHMITTAHRRVLVPQVDKVIDERVLLGTGFTAREALRPHVYALVTDFIHHIRADLSMEQIELVIRTYMPQIHNPTLYNYLQIPCLKMLLGLAETLTSRGPDPHVAKLMRFMFNGFLDRLDALVVMHEELSGTVARARAGNGDAVDMVYIEKSRPIGGAYFAVEKPPMDIINRERDFSRTTFKALVHGLRLFLQGLKRCDAPLPEGTLIFRLFDACIRCAALFDPDPRLQDPPQESITEHLGPVLLEVDPHVFQEIWTVKIEFFFDYAVKRIPLVSLCQYLLMRESTSSTMLSVILKFLVDRLPLLGDLDDYNAAYTIRYYKMAFGVLEKEVYTPTNESIIAGHLPKLLMDCFPLAAKASRPTHYYTLLRAIYRAIGSGRFDMLYKEVLPLLPEMLENMNRHLLASEGHARDMLVHLCLTIPLRLTHLLPHLTHLMHPLAIALKSPGPDLVAQGLRTLELCIDNLTPDFLDPTLNNVLRELMEALHDLLKPRPANHVAAHTAIRILGKLGGRNRRLLAKEPRFEWHNHSDPAVVTVSFGGGISKVALGPTAALALQALRRPTTNALDRSHAFEFVENCIVELMHEGVSSRDAEEVFRSCLDAVLESIHLAEFDERAEKLMKDTCRLVFAMEIKRNQAPREPGLRITPSPMMSTLLDAVPQSMAHDNPTRAKKAAEVVRAIVDDVIALRDDVAVKVEDLMPILHQIANRFTALAFDDGWCRKVACCAGIDIMTETSTPEIKWVHERESDLYRTLLHVLKDIPIDVERDVSRFVDTLLKILKMCNPHVDGQQHPFNRAAALMGVFFGEIQAPNPLVRDAAHQAMDCIVYLSGRPATELLQPHSDRLLGSIYTKPLRALPCSIQIGMIEAVRYCITLDPPLAELNDELLRLLHEALGLADAEDASLLGRNHPRQGGFDIVRLRVACIKLLTASMPLTDFYSKQHQTRQRVTSVYFKSLYSPSVEVKDVAHEGLRMVLNHQSRLPKELLQTGLRPILMNLADPKRLSVPGLEGLARLLELLTNYFKVEIGHKLLDHFRAVADPQMLQASSKLALYSNENITKLVRLANIFHLLPSAANIFLENLVNAIVLTEAQMHSSSRSPFSEPLAKYLNRYPSEGIDFFMRHLHLPRHVRTLRSILQARLAPNLERELASRAGVMVSLFIRGIDPESVLPALHLFQDMADLDDTWLQQHDFVIDALMELWRADLRRAKEDPAFIERVVVTRDIFIKTLQQIRRIDLLFEIVSLYTVDLGINLVSTTRFLYRHAALSEDVGFRRNILYRFLTWTDHDARTPAEKCNVLRYLITPILQVHAMRSGAIEELIDADYAAQIGKRTWYTACSNDGNGKLEETSKIEILHLTTILVQHYSKLLEDERKGIFRYAWDVIPNEEDNIVKQTALLLTARCYAAFQAPTNFIMRSWTTLLRTPQEIKNNIRAEALSAITQSLPGPEAGQECPQWASIARRLTQEEGSTQLVTSTICQLIVKHPQLFYPVRSLFVAHISNSLPKLGMNTTTAAEYRALSIEVLHVLYEWEQQAMAEKAKGEKTWMTPLILKENMVSYLIRIATSQPDPRLASDPRIALSFESPSHVVSRALALLKLIVGPKGFTDVTFGLRYFSKPLESLTNDTTVTWAVSCARVLQIIASEHDDDWVRTHAEFLHKLLHKGLLSEHAVLYDALYPILERLLRLYPLPKEDDDNDTPMKDFFNFVSTSISDGLTKHTSIRGTLLMIRAVVGPTPERVAEYATGVMKVAAKLAKDHISLPIESPAFDATVKHIIIASEICKMSISHFGDARKNFLAVFHLLIEKSKSVVLLRYILDMARDWAISNQQDSYPTMREKSAMLQKMVMLETRGSVVFLPYLQLVYDIFTEPTLRRSDLTHRLEAPFLVGCRSPDSALREKFLNLLDSSVPRSLTNRLTYIFGVQNWDALADHNWTYLAIYLLLGAADSPPRTSTSTLPMLPRPLADALVSPMRHLLCLDLQAAHDTWVSLFPSTWPHIPRRDQSEITYHLINCLTREYHTKQAQARPNVVQAFLAGAHACSPPMSLPPHLVKYLAKTYGAWHVGMEILGASLQYVKDDEPNIRDFVYDSLADVYAELAEEDMFYGVWRYRSLHNDTNNSLAFEQIGMWEQAQQTYEIAQTKARNGAIPFTEQEYCLWEDHWILAAQKLQQWDLLYELARTESNPELLLEAAWRTKNWDENLELIQEHISQLPDPPTIRRLIFEAFLALLKVPDAPEKNTEFTKALEDATQLSLRKWVNLPSHLSPAHIPLLQHFQQFVELQEAVSIYASLAQTVPGNLEKKSSDLKVVLQAWRERLPNIHDDISIWSDLVHWRQNVFSSINKKYIPLIPQQGQNGSGASNTNTFGYRGFHETAWIINRFAHVARKHELLDVCMSALTKIYTLPNIEISEAFLKLREQARCHYQKPSELASGLEVINNTNLVFFTASQKAEFYTLKGMFHAKMARPDEAALAFAQAVQLDMQQPKAWAQWGRFSDKMFKENSNDLSHAASAVTCYLQAAGLYKNGKSRPLLGRVLWLLSMDDATMTILRAFDTYKGETVSWFWISYIPQLCQAFMHKEMKQARYVLLQIARHYPQALFYHLRTFRDEILGVKRLATSRQAVARANESSANGSDPAAPAAGSALGATDGSQTSQAAQAKDGITPVSKQAWDYLEEIVQILKTMFPLLTLSMETLVDQIHTKFKLNMDEENYRNICLLLHDACSVYISRTNTIEDDGQLKQASVDNMRRVHSNMPPSPFEQDFLQSKLTHHEYMQKLQKWRDKYERSLDLRSRTQPLDTLSHYLIQFQYSKIDEIEVPGQYTEDKDNNQNFVRIQKFAPRIENGRTAGTPWKRFTVIGNDNSRTTFAMQFPYLRHFRREERTMQVFRTLNLALGRKKETLRRNLSFHVPMGVALNTNMRLWMTDSSYTTLQDVYDLHCEEKGISREEALFFIGERVRKTLRDIKNTHNRQQPSPTKVEYLMMKKDIMDELMTKLVPDTILTNYMLRTMKGPTELWRMRKQFTLQLAANSFLTYMFGVTHRNPNTFFFSRSTGQITMVSLTPGMAQNIPISMTLDPVPFRFTPNLQNFVGPIGTEALMTAGLVAIGRSLTDTEHELETYVCLFARDEMTSWFNMRERSWSAEPQFRAVVFSNIDQFVKRASIVACKEQREIGTSQDGSTLLSPVVSAATNLILQATNPLQLTKMGELYLPWF
ncbi:FAT domain-containing protein [Schizophyllum amplum]|uniref:FAT domain-containing protein n=1 Tax=Schizophyllum amplum TaxID=97359 RepID=A0A550CSM9_9AGAR|nr:FAT domain-containing protein [Auriculariopsis ampla]